jgi:ATP-dependent Zn protease
VAGESNASFLYCSASEFIEMYVGVGAKRIRDLFQQAREMPPCIIFIDEIDGVGSKRNMHHNEHASDSERSTTLNQLLTELDGFKESENIVLIGATNRFTLLDDALLRSGRFDTKIKLELPNQLERAGILSLHLNKKVHEVNADTIAIAAKKSDSFSGADLENLVNESAYICIHKNKEVIQGEDLLEALEKVSKQRR